MLGKKKSNLFEGKVPTLAELQKHIDDNFHIVNGQLVPNNPQPIIMDYITVL